MSHYHVKLKFWESGCPGARVRYDAAIKQIDEQIKRDEEERWGNLKIDYIYDP